MGPSHQTLCVRGWHQLHPCPMGSPGAPGHDQAATDHAGFGFFSNISSFRQAPGCSWDEGKTIYDPHSSPASLCWHGSGGGWDVPAPVPLQDHSAGAHVLHWTSAVTPPACTFLIPFDGV